MSDYIDTMEEELKYCRVCFATDVKMYNIDATDIGEIYYYLLDTHVYSESPQHACFECARMLLKYERFKSKCLEAHNILNKIQCNGKKVTKQVLNNIHREPRSFESNLTFSPIVVDSYISPDTSINETYNTFTVHEELILKPEAVDVKIDMYDDASSNDDDNDDLEEIPLKVFKYRASQLSKTGKQLPNNVDDTSDDGANVKKEAPYTRSNKMKRKLNEAESVVPRKKPPNKGNTNKYEGVLTSTEDYTVVWMTPEDALNDLLQRKETENYKLSPYRCSYCYKGYELLKPFENHMKRHTEAFGEYECDLCHVRFNLKNNLRNHVLCVHERRFNCNHCSYVSTYTTQARDHARSHKTKFPCKVCGKLYGASHSLVSHMKTRHPECVTEAVCDLCGNVLFSAAGLVTHKRKVHPRETNDMQGPECETCGVHFASDAAWKLHLVLSSKHETSNGCKMCGERFSSAQDLREHNKTHETRRKRENVRYNVQQNVTCDECGEQFDHIRVYRVHVKSEHPESARALLRAHAALVPVDKPYVCEVCGSRFSCSAKLGYHFRKHTGERPYKCGECDKAFNMKFQLAAHGTVHSRRDAAACRLCGRVLANKSALRKHNLAAHLNKRPHKCPLCDKRFVFVCDMKTHIKYAHDKVPYPKKKTAASQAAS